MEMKNVTLVLKLLFCNVNDFQISDFMGISFQTYNLKTLKCNLVFIN